jgi:hypothetical protein
MSIPSNNPKSRKPSSTLAISLKKELHVHPHQLSTIEIGNSEAADDRLLAIAVH